ncbi:hypothetical protein ABFX02_05G027000 [Erythranthe guttata]
MSSASPPQNSPVAAAPPPNLLSEPPTAATPPPQPPPETPPMDSLPPISTPPQPIAPPPKSPSPPDGPPADSPPPPVPTDPPPNSPPPPSSIPPEISPPPPPQPSNSTPPPPKKLPPPPSPKPPQIPPPPPLSKPPPESSPPPPQPPSPPPPPVMPPPKSGATPVPSPPPPPPPPAYSPSSNSLPKSAPPPATQSKPSSPIVLSPPSHFPPSPPHSPPSPPSVAPRDISRTNNSSGNETQNSPYSGSGSISKGGIVAIVLVLVFIVLGIVGSSACRAWKRKKKSSGHGSGYIMPTFLGSPQESDSALLKVQMSAHKNGSGSVKGIVYSSHDRIDFVKSRSCFTYKELAEATNGFSAHNLLGEGGFGYVYKGSLEDGREIAVKQLKIGGGQGEREFRSEVEIISRIHHRHLVSLVGYCIHEKRRLLVYTYVPNNNLHFHLHGEGRPALDWATRVKIAIGAARGIAYLHEDCHPRIIHRDIKSSNILLDNNFEARVSDFGLAKLAVDANTHVTTRVMGTFGYMAPEYASSGKLTDKSDVYSYGVVLLELITGRKPVDTSQPLGEESLVEWGRPLLGHALETQDFEGLADPMLERQYDDSEMFRMVEAAASCVRHSSAKRPKMGQVVRALDCMDSTDLTNGMRVGESEIFNYSDQSAEIRLFRRMAFGSQDYSTGFYNQNSWSSGNQVNSRRL